MISSVRNPRVADARRLSRRSGRDQQGAFLVEGRLGVMEVVRSPVAVVSVFAADGALEPAELAEINEAGIELIECTPTVAAALSAATTPQGVVAVATMPELVLDEQLPDDGLALVLDQVRDPGNAGTLIRSAVGAGCHHVVFGHGSVDPWSPKTLRAAAGAAFQVPVIRGAVVEQVLLTYRSAGWNVFATDSREGEPADEVDLSGSFALILGNEAWGLADVYRSSVDGMIKIPMPGPIESLNVAVAGSILLFEAARQRRASGRVYPRPLNG